MRRFFLLLIILGILLLLYCRINIFAQNVQAQVVNFSQTIVSPPRFLPSDGDYHPLCGNFIVEGSNGEECDLGFIMNQEGIDCNSICQRPDGWIPPIVLVEPTEESVTTTETMVIEDVEPVVIDLMPAVLVSEETAEGTASTVTAEELTAEGVEAEVVEGVLVSETVAPDGFVVVVVNLEEQSEEVGAGEDVSVEYTITGEAGEKIYSETFIIDPVAEPVVQKYFEVSPLTEEGDYQMDIIVETPEMTREYRSHFTVSAQSLDIEEVDGKISIVGRFCPPLYDYIAYVLILIGLIGLFLTSRNRERRGKRNKK